MPAELTVDHFALPVFDVAATLPFYRDVLGLPLVDALSGDDWGGKAWLMMIFELADGRQLALSGLRGATPPDPGALPRELRHFAFACASKEELSTWRQRLRDRGVTFREEDHGTQQSLYFEDPNGIVLEVTTPRDGHAVNPLAQDVVQRWLAP